MSSFRSTEPLNRKVQKVPLVSSNIPPPLVDYFLRFLIKYYNKGTYQPQSKLDHLKSERRGENSAGTTVSIEDCEDGLSWGHLSKTEK